MQQFPSDDRFEQAIKDYLSAESADIKPLFQYFQLSKPQKNNIDG